MLKYFFPLATILLPNHACINKKTASVTASNSNMQQLLVCNPKANMTLKKADSSNEVKVTPEDQFISLHTTYTNGDANRAYHLKKLNNGERLIWLESSTSPGTGPEFKDAFNCKYQLVEVLYEEADASNKNNASNNNNNNKSGNNNSGNNNSSSRQDWKDTNGVEANPKMICTTRHNTSLKDDQNNSITFQPGQEFYRIAVVTSNKYPTYYKLKKDGKFWYFHEKIATGWNDAQSSSSETNNFNSYNFDCRNAK